MRVNLFCDWMLLKHSTVVHFCQHMAVEHFQEADCTTNITFVSTQRYRHPLAIKINIHGDFDVGKQSRDAASQYLVVLNMVTM